jgi:hypothetical protein
MTLKTVRNSGFPSAESALQSPSRVKPVFRAIFDIPRARDVAKGDRDECRVVPAFREATVSTSFAWPPL